MPKIRRRVGKINFMIMKKIFLLLIFSLLGIAGFAEDVVAYYSMSSLCENDLKIEASEPKNGEFTYYIEIQGERLSDKVYMSIESSKLELFRGTLKLIRDKYKEWCKVAIDNNITDMKKEFPYKLFNVSYAWYGSKWWFSSDYILTPQFIILDDGKMCVSIYKKAVSRSNEYIDQKSYLLLNSLDEIDKLIEGTNPQIVYDYYNNKTSKEDLFH